MKQHVREHILQPLGDPLPREYGFVEQLLLASDLSSLALIMRKENEGDMSTVRAVLNGQVIFEDSHAILLPRMSLSPDGTKLAMHHQLGGGRHLVTVNGKKLYEIQLGGLHDLQWLDNERLAWAGSTRRTPVTHYFVNGEEVTGNLQFDEIIVDGGLVLVIQENGQRYTVNESGVRSQSIAVPQDHPISENYPPVDYDEETRRQIRTRPMKAVVEGGKEVVLYRDQQGPPFEKISNFGRMQTFALSGDESRVAYIGKQHPEWFNSLMRQTVGYLERATAREKQLEVQKHTPLRERLVMKLPKALRFPGFLIAYPLVMAVGPYGPFTWVPGAVQTMIPVNHPKPWAKGYHQVDNLFFTPNNELVASVSNFFTQQVVIDEQEGPIFQNIYNARWLPTEQCVCYVGRRGDQLFRVTVK